MAKRTTFATGILAGAALGTFFLACSSSTPAPTAPISDGGSTTPTGTTPFNETLTGCSPLQPGCYTYSGSGAYAAPSSTPSCASPGGATTGAADTHCVGQPAQTVSPASCGADDAGSDSEDSGAATDGGAASEDAGPAPVPGECGENGGDYGATMYGTEGNDDDCKYHVSYTASPLCENDGTYFVVKAESLAQPGTPVTGACTYAELCLSDTHVIPASDSRPPSGKQQVVEGPPGTYTIGPVQFDVSGKWTVRFHFNELCCDVADDSPHGHAAFFVTVP